MVCRTWKHNVFIVSARFVLDNYISGVFRKNDFYLTFKSKQYWTILKSTFKRKIQDGREIHLKMNKKLNDFKNVTITSFLGLSHGNAWFMANP